MPTPEGMFGAFGGTHVPESLLPILKQLDEDYARAGADASFWDELHALLKSFVGRATPLFPADALSASARSRLPRGDGARLWLKREDLLFTGSSTINHALGMALLGARAGRKKIVAESAGPGHALAVATAAAHFGLACEVYIGAADVRQHRAQIARVRLLGATINETGPGPTGLQSVSDAAIAAMRSWEAGAASTIYIPGSAIGPHPLPMIVRDFQCIIGRETKAQALRVMGKLPEMIVATLGGGADAVGMFYPFTDESQVKLTGVEAGGRSSAPGEHAAPLAVGRPGTFLGAATYALAGEDGPGAVYSVASSLAFAGAAPEVSYWKDLGRVRCTVAADDEAIHARETLARSEGIIASLESSHALAEALRLASEMKADQNIVVNLSGSAQDVFEDSPVSQGAA